MLISATRFIEICHDRCTLSSLIRFSVPPQTFHETRNSDFTVTVHRFTEKNEHKKIALIKTKQSVDPFAVNHREQDPPSIAKSFDGPIVTRTYGGPAPPFLFYSRRVALCCYVCCHNYFIEKLISPFPKHSPISVCETQRLNNSS